MKMKGIASNMNRDDLIEKLKTLDPDLPIYVYVNESETYGEVLGVDSVKAFGADEGAELPYAKSNAPEEELPFILIKSDYRG